MDGPCEATCMVPGGLRGGRGAVLAGASGCPLQRPTGSVSAHSGGHKPRLRRVPPGAQPPGSRKSAPRGRRCQPSALGGAGRGASGQVAARAPDPAVCQRRDQPGACRGHADCEGRRARVHGRGRLPLQLRPPRLPARRLSLHLPGRQAQRRLALWPPRRAEPRAGGAGQPDSARHGRGVPLLHGRRDLHVSGVGDVHAGAARRIRSRLGGDAGGGADHPPGGLLQGHAQAGPEDDAHRDVEGRALRRGRGRHDEGQPHAHVHVPWPGPQPRPRRPRRGRLRSGRQPQGRPQHPGEPAVRAHAQGGHGHHRGAGLLLRRLPDGGGPGGPCHGQVHRSGAPGAASARGRRAHRGRRGHHGHWLPRPDQRAPHGGGDRGHHGGPALAVLFRNAAGVLRRSGALTGGGPALAVLWSDTARVLAALRPSEGRPAAVDQL
mmetsp:Transcript_124187/g.362434  ORF Transcript_124187/g.362434 Transcript_124187/m.362434 type:complete len:435 (+) Transcript_124187:419-1723(+)